MGYLQGDNVLKGNICEESVHFRNQAGLVHFCTDSYEAENRESSVI